MINLDILESQSIQIMREVVATINKPVLLNIMVKTPLYYLKIELKPFVLNFFLFV